MLMQQKFDTCMPIVRYAFLVANTRFWKSELKDKFSQYSEQRASNELANSYAQRAYYLNSRSIDLNLFGGRLFSPTRLYEKAIKYAVDPILANEIMSAMAAYSNVVQAREIVAAHTH